MGGPHPTLQFLLAQLGPDRLGAGLHFLSLGSASNLPQHRGVVLEASGHIGVVRPQRLLPDRKRPLEQRVGSSRENPFGLYDTLGNVTEWVEDCWTKTYVGAPADGSALRHEGCEQHVLRGASWADGYYEVSSASRFRLGGRFSGNGFRVVE